MNETLVGPTELTGNAINEYIVKELLPVATGKSVPLFSAAALTLILCSIRPEIPEDELTQGLKDISAYVTCWVSALDERMRVQAGEPVGKPN